MEYTDFYDDLVEDYPSGWNKDEFEKINSFAGKLRYANTHLKKLASGSGRTVFIIDDKKVLKIAKNKKGLAQNSVEAEGYLQNYDIVARVYDTDANDFWVEMAHAKKIGKKRFQQLTGVTLEEIGTWMRIIDRRSRWQPNVDNAFKEKMANNEFVQDLERLIGDYDMATGDFGRASTWGEVEQEGKPKVVLVDFGLTYSVYDDFYRVKM
jgi:hypothetical protein